ncbi:hypothetical protein GGI15_002152 [Coemansia interrupta]|uniref:Uncharacterized protein n=1 Tax=Coemansia interrupta TaxID=1126814 RepID=A0A9W8HGX6_9FUNG|nr:hypothetical protein GGI15_002152 [Coemansia interrupta]
MRYNSPVTQLAILATVLLLTTGVRRLLDNYLNQYIPVNVNLSFNSYLPAGIVGCVSGSVVSMFLNGSSGFQTAAIMLGIIGYYPCRVATLVIVLAYTAEKWKARALAVFLIIEYLSNALGDIIALRSFGHSSESERFHYAIVYLVLACVSPLLALCIAPSDQVVRSNGLYLISPKTTLKTEIVETGRIFTKKYMLLLIPYMFSYPMLFAIANLQLPDQLIVAMYDIGKVLVMIMGQLLDVQWASRRVRGLIGLLVIVLFYLISVSLTTVARVIHYDMTGLDPNWSRDQYNQFIFKVLITQQYKLLLSVLFFAGLISGLIELYGYWIMGTLTNDLKSSARFVGTYHSFMALGGLVGYQIVRSLDFVHAAPAYYVAIATTTMSFGLAYFVVRRITETNNWSLGRITHNQESFGKDANVDTEIVAIIADVKHQHVSSTQTQL